MQILVIFLGWTWLGVIFFSGPFLLRSHEGVLTALRNGAVAVLRYPIFTTTLLLLSFLLLLILPLLMVLTFSLLAILATRASNWVLQREGILPPETEPVDEWVDR